MPFLFKLLGVLGLLLIIRSIFVHKELRRDVWSLFGGICLLAYSIYLQDIIFIILQAVFSLANIFEIWKLKSHSSKLPIAVSTDEVIRLESGDKDL